MKRQITMVLFVFLAQFSFGQKDSIQQRLKKVDEFVHYLQVNDQQAIYDVSFHTPATHISDVSMRRRYVKGASELIAKYGLPPKKDWVYTYDLHNPFARFSVAINFRVPVDTVSERRQVSASILIKFPPEEISDRIYEFDIEEKFYWPNGIKLQAPGPAR